MLNELKDCPFCGNEAVLQVQSETFQIIGCNTPDDISMLCPSPSMVVYPDKNGNYKYKHWNTRYQQPAQDEALGFEAMPVSDRIDYMAELFHKETGRLAPYKDGAAIANNPFDKDELQQKWADYIDDFYGKLCAQHKAGQQDNAKS